jgi:hypothetical protein
MIPVASPCGVSNTDSGVALVAPPRRSTTAPAFPALVVGYLLLPG